jgi:hypothetical protein
MILYKDKKYEYFVIEWLKLTISCGIFMNIALITVIDIIITQ